MVSCTCSRYNSGQSFRKRGVGGYEGSVLFYYTVLLVSRDFFIKTHVTSYIVKQQ